MDKEMKMIRCEKCFKGYHEYSSDGKPIEICPYCGTARRVKPARQQGGQAENMEKAGVFGRIYSFIEQMPLKAKLAGLGAVVCVVVLIVALNVQPGPAGEMVSAAATENLLAENEARVPSVIGEWYEDAETIAAEENLLLVITDKVFSEEVEADKVLSQSPLPGRIMAKGGAIKVVISTNIKETELGIMPDVVFHTQGDAEELLKEAGILYEISYAESNVVQAGNVISQSIEAGEKVEGSATVKIIISTGSPKQKEANRISDEADSGAAGNTGGGGRDTTTEPPDSELPPKFDPHNLPPKTPPKDTSTKDPSGSDNDNENENGGGDGDGGDDGAGTGAGTGTDPSTDTDFVTIIFK